MITVLVWLVLQSTIAQFNQDCTWGDFSLQGAQGYEIQCITNDESYAYGYTPCMSYALCVGQRYQAVYFNRNNGQCQFYLAEWDDGETEPQYSLNTDDIAQWTFNYANGEVTADCPEGVEFEIAWECDPNAVPFSLQTTCDQISICKHTMKVRSVYACTAPPPYNDCIWGNFNLQGARGYQMQCIDDVNHQFTYAYTPCLSYTLCNGIGYQSTLFNRDTSQCEYYLAQWDNGDTMPVYFNDGGNPLWQFNYRNGEETEQCPDGIELGINWVCDEACTPWCLNTQCNQVNECRHQITANSSYACVIGDDEVQNTTSVVKLLEVQKQLRFTNN